MPLEKPKTAGLHDAAELAESAGVATQSVYNAMRMGWVAYKQMGRLKKLTADGYEYHRRFGWGPGIPRHGTAAAVEYQRERDAEEAAARAAAEAA